jgi:small-conductance mechanosensitive channel/CRP-like cAMP-binding protein
MDDWQRLQQIALTWTGLLATIAALLLALFLRRLLPENRRRRGRVTVAVLAIAPLVHFVAHGLLLLGATTTSAVLEIVMVVLLGAGITGLLGMLVFDLALARTSVPTIVRDILQALAFLVLIVVALRNSGINPLSLITTSAVLTAVIGLAFQNIMANLLSGIALQIDRTVVLGDYVQVGARVGKIAQIRWRSTSILTREGDTVVVPNAQLLSNEVLNFSRPNSVHRSSFRMGFHLRHPPNDVKRVVLGALEGVPGILAEPAPACSPVEFGDKSITYAIRYSIDDMTQEPSIEGEVRTRLWYAAQRAGLEGPCPAPLPSGEIEIADRVAALQTIGLFSPLEPDELARLAAGVKELRFAAGERILAQGSPGDSLYVVRDGTVRVELSEQADRPVAMLQRGECFGEMSLMTGEPRRASCAAASDVLCYVLDREAFHAILRPKPQIAEAISELLARRSEALAGAPDGPASTAPAERSAKLLSRMRAYFHLD